MFLCIVRLRKQIFISKICLYISGIENVDLKVHGIKNTHHLIKKSMLLSQK